jgi:hypothetical protein
MSLFDADFDYILKILLDTIASIWIWYSTRGYLEINFLTQMLDILRELNHHQKIYKNNKW